MTPNYTEMQVVDKDGKFTPTWRGIMQQLLTQLQINLSDNGFRIPNKISDDIKELKTSSTTGTLLYDSTTDELKVRLAADFKVIETK